MDSSSKMSRRPEWEDALPNDDSVPNSRVALSPGAVGGGVGGAEWSSMGWGKWVLRGERNNFGGGISTNSGIGYFRRVKRVGRPPRSTIGCHLMRLEASGRQYRSTRKKNKNNNLLFEQADEAEGLKGVESARPVDEGGDMG